MAKKPRTPAPPRPAQAPRPVQAPKRRDAPRQRRQLDRRFLFGGIGAIVVVAAIVAVFAIVAGGSGGGASHQVDFATLPGLQEGPPPWNNGTATLPQRMQPLGLEQLGAEGTALHIHQHLDIYIDGKHYVAPAYVGIYADSWLTQLHTHAPDGVIHVESPTVRDYNLGEFFGVWGVRLSQRCIGSECGTLRWWVNGKQQIGNPANLNLRNHQLIVLSIGKPPAHIRTSFDWANSTAGP
jgi:hypothetical protein